MTGFIGAGNMANAIIKGMVSSGAAEGKDIAVYPFNDFDDGGRPVVIVDYGECLGCLSRVVLPGDEFGPFVRKNCVKTSFV